MNHPYYYQDPIFKDFDQWNNEFRRCARKYNVHPYIIDPPMEDKVDNSDSAVTTTIIVREHSPTYISTNKTFWGVYYTPYELVESTPTKKFCCFINRLDPIRQSWFYQLIRRGMLDQGHVSCNLDVRNPVNGVSNFASFEQNYNQYLTIFNAEHQIAKNIVPYKNFTDSGDLTDTILDSKINLVLETFVTDSGFICFSEKIFRALQLPRLWLLHTHKHGVSHLRNMGFDLLDDVVDHNRYDNVDHEIVRQSIILDMLQELADREIDLHRVTKAALHNQTLLKEFSKVWIHDLEVCCAEAANYKL